MASSAEDIRQSWVEWALQALADTEEDYNKYEDYYVGDHELEFATDKWKTVFGSEFEEFADNWCQVVIDSMCQRLQITGWRSEDDKAAEKLAEDIWDRNKMQVEADDLHTQAAVKGDGYLIVWPDPEDELKAQIFYNDALNVTVFYDPSNRRKMAHAAKKFVDMKGDIFLYIYTPTSIQRYVAPRYATSLQVWEVAAQLETVMPAGWRKLSDEPNPFEQIPVFHFRNRSLGATHGISELKSVIPIQNAVNKLLMDLMVASEFGAFRQKWIAGGGMPKEGWKAGADRIWATTDPNAKFGDFSETDLEPITRAIDTVVGHIAKVTQTPMHYLRTSGDMPSGEALKTAESGLVEKIKARQKSFGSVWSDAMTFALRIEGHDAKSPVYPVWKAAETRHDLEQAQTAQLKSILGIPLTQLWSEHFGYTEEEISEFEKENKAVAASVLAQVISQIGQLPPGTEKVAATPQQLIELLNQGNLVGNAGEGEGLDLAQILSLLPKTATAGTTAGEATAKPQPNSRPPASPTRRSTGFKD